MDDIVKQNVTAALSSNKEMVPVVSFVGYSGMGKTTLLEQVIGELKQLGYRVAVVKHAPHGFALDHPGKDSWRLNQAGSDIVVLSSPERVSLVEHVDEELTLSQIEALIRDNVDIVLVEGYKKDPNSTKVMVLGSEEGQPTLGGEEGVLATISARSSPPGMSQFDYNDVTKIVGLLIERIGENSTRKSKNVSAAAD